MRSPSIGIDFRCSLLKMKKLVLWFLGLIDYEFIVGFVFGPPYCPRFIEPACLGSSTPFKFRNLPSNRNLSLISLDASSNQAGKNDNQEKKGYKFGDISRAIGRKISGKEDYKFGDLTKGAIEAGVKNFNDDYEFGDLSRWVDSRIKKHVNAYTKQDEYKFGDITKEFGRRIRSGEYTLDDLLVMLKILTSVGIGLAPGVAGLMPAKLLVELLNLSIMQDVGDRVRSSLAMELDRRMKQAMTGNTEYKIGDLTKSAVNKFTGKDQYSFGDITRTIINERDSKLLLGTSSKDSMDPKLVSELEKLDQANGIEKINKST